MKAKPIGEINGHPIYPQGCIVGKALEGLKEGKGKDISIGMFNVGSTSLSGLAF